MLLPPLLAGVCKRGAFSLCTGNTCFISLLPNEVVGETFHGSEREQNYCWDGGVKWAGSTYKLKDEKAGGWEEEDERLIIVVEKGKDSKGKQGKLKTNFNVKE